MNLAHNAGLIDRVGDARTSLAEQQGRNQKAQGGVCIIRDLLHETKGPTTSLYSPGEPSRPCLH